MPDKETACERWHLRGSDRLAGKTFVMIMVSYQSFPNLLGKSKSKSKFGVLPLLYASDAYAVNEMDTI